MKRATAIALISILVVLTGSLLLLRSYKLDLVYTAVLNAVIQKAPSDYPAEEIQEAFSIARLRAERKARQEEFLQGLLRLSQRLEKIQSLSKEDLDEILDEVAQ